MSQRWKVTVVVLATAGVVTTPLIWLLDSPDAGQLAGASIQGAAGITALVWAVFQRSSSLSPAPGPGDVAVDTGTAQATGGGAAHTGVRRPGGAGTGQGRAERTGDATAQDPGSSASTGIDYS